MRDTLASVQLVAQTAPAPTAMPIGDPPIGDGPPHPRPLWASTRVTERAYRLATQTRAVPEGDAARAAGDPDGLDDRVRLGADARERPGEAAGHPDGVAPGRDPVEPAVERDGLDDGAGLRGRSA